MPSSQDPQKLAGMALGKLRKKKAELAQAVQGTVRENQRFLLDQLLAHLDFLDKQIATFDQEIARHLGLLSEPEEPGPCPASDSSSQAVAHRAKTAHRLLKGSHLLLSSPRERKTPHSLLKRSQTRK
jgi:hypothetical protein